MNNKYKDLEPKKTIENIKNFFKSKNLEIIHYVFQSQESSTWSCYVKLLSYNQVILQTCGKGQTEEFALASGYGEMYERFCNYLNIIFNPISYNLMIENNYKKNHYYLDKNEKLLSFQDLKNNKNLFENLKKIFGNENNLEIFTKLISGEKIIGVPYKNCFNFSQIEYYDPRLLVKLNSSSGMAAGNTIEEALVQGISEIFEHQVQELFLKNPPSTLYEIPYEKMNLNNKKIIDNINKQNKKIKIYDLSYNYNFPVCLAILYNSFTYNYIINFGSAPILSIAIERTLTELYQNIQNFNHVEQMPQFPSRLTSWENQMSELYKNTTKANCFPEIFNFSTTNNKNSNRYLQENKNYSNKDFLSFYEKICKENNLNLFFWDNSKDNDIKSVHIISPYYNYRNFIEDFFSKIPSEKKLYILNIAINYFKIIYEINYLNQSDKNFLNQLNEINYLTKEEINFINYIFGGNTSWFYPLSKTVINKGIYNLLKKENCIEEILLNLKNSLFELPARKYLSLYQYKISNQYSDEEIYQIFSQLDDKLSLEEISMCNNHDFLFYKIILEPMKMTYSSNAFMNMVDAYCD